MWLESSFPFPVPFLESFWGNIRTFFRVDVFYFSNLAWKVRQIALEYTTDETSSVIRDSCTVKNELNDDLVKINNWAHQWKMIFNPDLNKQAREVIFSRKTKKINDPPITISNNTVSQTTSLKHLGVILDSNLTFNQRPK